MMVWTEVAHRAVRDTDGFYSVLTLYTREGEDCAEYTIVFGDPDYYDPNEDDTVADGEFGIIDSRIEAISLYTDFSDLDELEMDYTHTYLEYLEF